MKRFEQKRRTAFANLIHMLAFPVAWLLHKLGVWEDS
jgi:hypothetical protein